MFSVTGFTSVGGGGGSVMPLAPFTVEGWSAEKAKRVKTRMTNNKRKVMGKCFSTREGICGNGGCADGLRRIEGNAKCFGCESGTAFGFSAQHDKILRIAAYSILWVQLALPWGSYNRVWVWSSQKPRPPVSPGCNGMAIR